MPSLVSPTTYPAESVPREAPGGRHLWMNYTPMRGLPGERFPVIARAEGCWVEDQQGKRYLDGLSSLFCVNSGHGRAELAEAAARQARELDFFPTWSYAHPPALELAERLAALAPGDLNRVFFCSGGSEAVEAAIKLARQYHKVSGRPAKTKLIAREVAYHGTTMGALAVTGLTELREPFEPFTPGGCHVPATNAYRLAEGHDPSSFADAIEERILFEGPDTVAAVVLEPVQNAGGCFVPPEGYFQRVREICDRHDVLLISDEVICAWGRLGHYFGCERFDYQPDIVTVAKGLSNASFALGAVLASDRIAAAFAAAFADADATFLHGFTFGGHPIGCAVALANLDLIEREGLLENVRANEARLRRMVDSMRSLPIVGDVRGAGYFLAIELVRDQETKETFTPEQCRRVLREYVAAELFKRGLICRADDRGEPVIQLAPPTIAGGDEFEVILDVLPPVLERAWEMLDEEPRPV